MVQRKIEISQRERQPSVIIVSVSKQCADAAVYIFGFGQPLLEGRPSVLVCRMALMRDTYYRVEQNDCRPEGRVGVITSRQPESWQELQEAVGAILRECGFAVEVEKEIDTVRGTVEIDVYSEENVNGRKYVILCECKHWKNRVPQNVIHGFRSVVADSGANLGYIISSAGFQSGSFSAADLTNMQLMTWPEFQQAFEKTWIERHLLPFVAEHFERLLEFTGLLLPTEVTRLPENRRQKFLALKQKYDAFGVMLVFVVERLVLVI